MTFCLRHEVEDCLISILSSWRLKMKLFPPFLNSANKSFPFVTHGLATLDNMEDCAMWSVLTSMHVVSTDLSHMVRLLSWVFRSNDPGESRHHHRWTIRSDPTDLVIWWTIRGLVWVFPQVGLHAHVPYVFAILDLSISACTPWFHFLFLIFNFFNFIFLLIFNGFNCWFFLFSFQI